MKKDDSYIILAFHECWIQPETGIHNGIANVFARDSTETLECVTSDIKKPDIVVF